MRRQAKLLTLIVFATLAVVGHFHFSSVEGQTTGTSLSAPTGVTASDGAYANKVGITWDAVANASQYTVLRGISNDNSSAAAIGSTAALSFFDITATPSQTYYYWVRATNGPVSSQAGGPDTGFRAAVIAAPAPGQPLNPPPGPSGNPVTAAKAYLGKVLFFDEQMSSTKTVSCGTCHKAGSGGSDIRTITGSPRSTNPGADQIFNTPDDVYGSPGVPLNAADGSYQWSESFGFNEQVTSRKARSFIDAAFSQELFWDGRASDVFKDPITGNVVLASGAALESQVLSPPVASAEMAYIGRDWNDVAARIASSEPLALSPAVPSALSTWIGGRSYSQLFAEAFGTSDVTPVRIAMAIATYERTLYSDQTPLDGVISGSVRESPADARGRALFAQIQCNACHAGALLSDNRYHYIGVRPASEDPGRFNVTSDPNDLGKMRTPSLRNVALRGPYMHDGRFATLAEVVDFYNRGGDFDAPNKEHNLIRPRNLTAQQKSDLVAFLTDELTDPRVKSEADPFDRPVLYSESSRVPQVTGNGSAGTGDFVPNVVAIEPPFAGNPSFTVGVYNAMGSASAVLVIDKTEPPAGPAIPSTGSLARVNIGLSGSGIGNGYGSATISIPNDPLLIGQTFFGRWYVLDSGAPGGVAASPVFKITIFGLAGESAPSVKITGYSVSGKQVIVTGSGFEAGDIVEINGQPAKASTFIDSNTFEAKKGVKLLLSCGSGGPSASNTISIMRNVGGNLETLGSGSFPVCQ